MLSANRFSHKHSFEPHDDPIIIFADKIKIFEVLSNLLNNAIKFSNGESITVSTTESQNDRSIANHVNFKNPKDGKSNIEKIQDNELVIVSIRDKGKGIDEEILPRLFNKFVTKSNQGTGLGLYIAKSIVEAHGGQIWAHNNKNKNGQSSLLAYHYTPNTVIQIHLHRATNSL